MYRFLLALAGFGLVNPSFGQISAFELPLEISDGVSTISMVIGMQEAATDAFDNGLDIPTPPPPPANFLQAYSVTDAGSLWHDYRGLTADTVRFAMFIDANENVANPIVIKWDDTVDLASLGSFRIKNILEEQETFDFDMTSADSLDLNGPPDLTDGVVIEVVLGATNTSTADEGELPKEAMLMQNYPNPFNPSTMIGFDLPATGHVDLRVYDTLGREVAVLANEVRAAGRHQVQWDATGFSSGAYFYRLRLRGDEGERVRISRQMLLLR